MDIGSLLNASLILLEPFFWKTGEAIAESIGSDLWLWIKSKVKKNKILSDNPSKEQIPQIKKLLEDEITNNASFAKELELKIQELKNSSNRQNNVNIKNEGTIGKIVTLNDNNGTINL